MSAIEELKKELIKNGELLQMTPDPECSGWRCIDTDVAIKIATQALTKAHQAGINEGKFEERVKWETYQDQVESIFNWLQGVNGDFPDLSQKPHYRFRTQLRTMRKALDDTIKALQDKK